MFPHILGWNHQLDHVLSALSSTTLALARVTQVHRGGPTLLSEFGPRRGHLTGRLLQADDWERPAVGDWVQIAPLDENEAVVVAVLPRINQLVRTSAGRTSRPQVLVANLDLALIATAADADFNLSRLERYLALVRSAGIDARILLTKVDLDSDRSSQLADIARIAPDSCIPVSAATGEGLDAVRALLGPGRTAVVLGSSGVGKSTLINRLLGEERLATASVRDSDQRGRHTTTFRNLICLPEGGVIIDTPGLRELLPVTDASALAEAFADIEALAEDCRFRDCGHNGEPGCAVQAAVEDGTLERRRLENYHKLVRETAHARARTDEREAWAQKRKNRQFGLMAREAQVMKRKLRG